MAMMAAGLAAAGLVTAMPQDPAFLPPTNPDASGSSSNDTGPSFVPFTPVFEQFYPSGQQPVFVPDTPQAPNPAFVGGSGGQTDAGTYASSGPSATSSGGLASTAIPPAGTGGAAGNKTGTGSPTSPTATPAPAPSMTYPGGLSQCQYMQILKMTSVFETGSTKFNWGACGNNNDGHGLSVGVVQFTTSTSVYDLVVEYDRLSGGSSKLTQYLGALKASKSKGPQGSSGQGVMDGLWSFCSDFGKLGSDPNFQQAQLNLQNKLYFQPAADAAAKHGITAPLFLGQAYDTAIQLGVGVVGQLAQNAGGKSGDQAAYMSAYLWARNDMLNNWGGAYPGTKYRTNAYRHCLDNGGLMLAGTVEILDNGGYKTISIGC
ncbi:hypothetical protein HK101_010414 [Irineochytrium annulatum]|nr:hypothetical protein HK101_010414 [Irineochytrium annulatum]